MKIAIILFNLGGPDSLDAVQPFLRNLFSDPAIITLPAWLRLPLASFIARRRAPKARGIYEQIGGGSPIVGQTEAQARALEEALGTEHEWRGYVCMRYWHPMTDAVVRLGRSASHPIASCCCRSIRNSRPRRPHRRSTPGRRHPASRHRPVEIESYPTEPGFIRASIELVKQGLAEAGDRPNRVLFSAHGLPEKIIKAGDPYQSQVEQTAAEIGQHLDGIEWSVCYQSRVGPLKWIGPSTDAEIRRAGTDKTGVVLYPLSFVSEHSETLVELDIDYRRLAEQAGVPKYVRVPTVGTHSEFIHGLANLVQAALWSTKS